MSFASDRYSLVMRRIAKCYRKYFNPNRNVFDSSQRIEEPTLLINAEFRSAAKLFGLIPIRWIPSARQLLPVTSPILLRLYFENLYDRRIPEREKVRIGIFYPHPLTKPSRDDALNINPDRPWHLQTIPSLQRKHEYAYTNLVRLFVPEVPGTHLLVIAREPSNYKYADYHGITDREFKQIPGDWTASFHVITAAEFYLYIIASFSLLVSLIVLGITVYECFD